MNCPFSGIPFLVPLGYDSRSGGSRPTTRRHLPQRTGYQARHDRIYNSKKTQRHSAWLACIHPQLEGKAPMSTGNLTRRAALAGASAVPLATIVASSTAASASTAMPETGIDRAATIARAEYLVERLADRFVKDGWHEHFDRQRAAKFIDALRRQNYSEFDEASEIVVQWMRDHGQSLDWLYTGEVGSMLCRAAKGSPAARAIPGELDPIVALIEEHRSVEAAFNRALGKKTGAERRFERETGALAPQVECEVVYSPGFLGGMGKTLEEVLIRTRELKGGTETRTARSHEEIDEILRDDPEQAKTCHALLDQRIAKHERDLGPHERREEEMSAASSAALDKIFAATATSATGISALFDYAFGRDRKGRPNFDCAEDAWGFLEVIQRSFRELAAGQESVQS